MATATEPKTLTISQGPGKFDFFASLFTHKYQAEFLLYAGPVKLIITGADCVDESEELWEFKARDIANTKVEGSFSTKTRKV